MHLSRSCAALIAFCLLFAPETAPAQSGAEDGFVVVDTAAPPQGERSQAYLDIARKKRARAQVEYVTELTGQLIDGRANTPNSPTSPTRTARDPITFNGYGAALAVAAVIGLLLVWLKFGGSGTVLSREPRADRKSVNAPQSWRISQEDMDVDPPSLLARIAGMGNRTEALILLLRHSLLVAARATDIRFARSDTERSAMDRLPKSWRHHKALQGLLRKTELAHYGGRDVTEDDFRNALALGEIILMGARRG